MAYSSKTTVSTKYRVSGGNSVISTTFSSPFEAIGRAFKVGGKVTETDSGVTIFESNTTKYYLFQFTNFYGSTASRTEADSWINDYANAHVIYGGTGKLYGSNAKVLKGGLFRTEATNGAYLYNFSSNNWGFRSIKTTVSLSKAKLYFSPKNRADNAYIYVAAISEDGSEVYETGIMMDQYARSSKAWKAYHFDSNGNISASPIATTARLSSGVYTANDDIVIKMSLNTGNPGYSYRIETASGQLKDSGTINLSSTSKIRAGNKVRFLTAVSFVPDLGYENNTYSMQDLRDGAYLKNVILESYLYTSTDQQGTAYGVTATSDPPQYSYIYDTDCIDHTRNDSKDIINIYYNKSYTH